MVRVERTPCPAIRDAGHPPSFRYGGRKCNGLGRSWPPSLTQEIGQLAECPHLWFSDRPPSEAVPRQVSRRVGALGVLAMHSGHHEGDIAPCRRNLSRAPSNSTSANPRRTGRRTCPPRRLMERRTSCLCC